MAFLFGVNIMSNYYKNQLSKLTKQISVKFTSADQDTNWMDFEQPECKAAIADFAGSSEQYQGWPNRETWAAYTYIMELPPEQEAQLIATTRDCSAESLRTFFDTLWSSDMGLPYVHSALKDIGSLWRVDWNAIAEALQE